jgi:2-phosphosulfolactate phosphatase
MLAAMLTEIDVAILPAEARLMGGSVFAVVDVLRATTTIAAMFHHGVSRITAVDDLERARGAAAEGGAILFGEVDGLPPAGFGHGNSPRGIAALSPAGREGVMFTTNGTRALCAIADLGPTIGAALANATAVAGWLAGAGGRAVIVCAGNAAGTRFSLEDFAAAGAIVRRLRRLCPDARIGDAATLAAETATALVEASAHAALLRSIGLAEDVSFCAQEDTCPVVPLVTAAGAGYAVLSLAV